MAVIESPEALGIRPFHEFDAANSVWPRGQRLVNIRNRLVVVQFEDFEGETKTLVWEPTVPEGSREAPFYAQLAERYGETFEKVGAKFFNTVEDALAKVGLTPA